jgi:ABC-2 type transport system ATP-binding protein
MRYDFHSMIEIKNLSKRYGPITAIQNLSFKVNKGEVVGFLGPNGAGKSTTMKIITGYMAPSEGEVKVAGYDVFENPIEVKQRIGFLPETPPLYADMTVKAFLRFVARIKRVPEEKITSKVDLVLEKAGLTDVQKRLIQNLSKGYKQRVGIAQALVSEPELLILDEPTVGLDPKQVAEIRSLIQGLRGSHTIVLSTHILTEVQATCGRIIIIDKGKIVAEDTLEQLQQQLRGIKKMTVRVRRLSDGLVATIKNLPGVQEAVTVNGLIEVTTDGEPDHQERLASAIVQAGAGLLELKASETSLEEIFLQLTDSKPGAR